MIKYFAKKYLLKQLNGLLGNLRDNQKVEYWKYRIAKIMTFLNNLMEYLDDNTISDEEAKKVVEEVKDLWK